MVDARGGLNAYRAELEKQRKGEGIVNQIMLRQTGEEAGVVDVGLRKIEIEAWLESALRGTTGVVVLAGDPQSARTLKEIYNRFCMTHRKKGGEDYAQ